MVSKSSAPHSIRFRNDLWERLVAHAEKLGVTPNEAVIAIIETAVSKPRAALKIERAPAIGPDDIVTAAGLGRVKLVDVQVGPIRRKPGDLAKKGKTK